MFRDVFIDIGIVGIINAAYTMGEKNLART
jgi:hypothetical protein